MGVCEGVLGMGSVGVRRLESVGVRGYVGESRKALGDNRWEMCGDFQILYSLHLC